MPHITTYAVLLMAEAEGASWRHIARVTLNIDPEREPEKARRAWTSHLARAQWLSTTGLCEAQSDSLQWDRPLTDSHALALRFAAGCFAGAGFRPKPSDFASADHVAE